MIVIGDKVYHTGTNVEVDEGETRHEIPLSRFKVTAKTLSNEPWGDTDEFDAVDESDAISQYVQKFKIPMASSGKSVGSSRLKFIAKAVKENRIEELNPPEPKTKMLGTPSKGKKKAD